MTADLMPRAVRTSAVFTVLALALSLSACNGGGSSSQQSSSGSPSPSVSAPEGVVLTEPGTQLEFGQSATVAHHAGGQDAVLRLAVDSAMQGSVKDFSGFALDDPYKKRGSYYYVRVSVRNEGTNTVAGLPVPLWGVSGADTLLQPVSFTTGFSKCPSDDLPKKFESGDRFKTCLVFLSPKHGSLKGVSYRPSESYDPIEWHGKVEPEKALKKGKKGKKPKRGKNH